MEQEFDLKTYIDVLRRRYLYLLLPIAPIFALACAVAYLIPPVYDASAKILVQSQQIPTDLARSTVTTDATQQIEVIRQRLMTRANLLQIARKFDLHGQKRRKRSPSEIVDSMREDTRIEHIAVGSRHSRRGQQSIAFSVSFQYGDPKKASSVANEFVSLMLEQNIKTRTNRAAETHRFFVQQVVKLDKDLAAQEALILEFKHDNEAALPDSLGYRRVLHTRLQGEKSEIDRQIGALQADKERLLRNADGAITAQDANATEVELARLRLQLTQLRAVYSDRHPAVKKAVRRLEALEKASATEAEAQNAAAKKELEQPAPAVQVNARITAQITEIDRKVSALNERRGTLQARIADIEETILKTPQVEIALRKLTRKYDLLQNQQRKAQAKVAEAATGELLEENRQAERFEVIERATAPSKPTKPNRPQVILAGFFVSVAAGIGLVLLVELLDSSIRTSRDLEKRLQIRPLATIPLVTTHAERSGKNRRKVAWLFGAVLLVAGALFAAHMFYQPLDLMLFKLMQRVGL